ncbi:MAG: hypothetical protein ACRD3Q_09680, partial [Terriglobales bacterium]
QGQVTGIFSGDTVEVAMPDGKRQVHLLGITAPQADQQQCWAGESRQFADQTLSGKQVSLYLAQGEPTPAPGAPVGAYIMLSSDDYAILALEAGAVEIDGNANLSDLATTFNAAQDSARQSKKGLWGSPCNGDLAPLVAPSPGVTPKRNPPPPPHLTPPRPSHTGKPQPTKPWPTWPRPTKPWPTKPTATPTQPTQSPTPTASPTVSGDHDHDHDHDHGGRRGGHSHRGHGHRDD